MPNRSIVTWLDSTSGQIVPRLRAHPIVAKILVKPSRRRLIHVLGPIGLLGLRPGIGRRLLHFDPDLPSEIADRFRETRSGDPRQKREHIASGTAAETMKDLPGRADRERRTLFLVEGTQPLQILSGAGQTDMLPNEVDDIDPISDLIDNLFRNQASAHGSRSSSPHRNRWIGARK